MNGFRVLKRFRMAALVTVALTTGCSWVGDTIKSELSTYAEPKDGELSYLRLVGSRNVKVYPNSLCADLTVPGSGYPAGPQMGGQRKRDLGMPKPAPRRIDFLFRVNWQECSWVNLDPRRQVQQRQEGRWQAPAGKGREQTGRSGSQSSMSSPRSWFS